VHEITELQESDFSLISQRLDSWWGGRNMVLMLPRLWFKDFASTSFAVRDEKSQLIAFLVGYISQTDSTKAYVHFIGVDPACRKDGLGRSLYEAFAAKALSLGANRIEAVTSPINATSLRFHESLGFMAKETSGELVLPTQASGHKDFDGIGEDRVVLVKPLPF
jgi:ribosomal protein S18 acetylase RimI-like enzyme